MFHEGEDIPVSKKSHVKVIEEAWLAFKKKHPQNDRTGAMIAVRLKHTVWWKAQGSTDSCEMFHLDPCGLGRNPTCSSSRGCRPRQDR